MGQPELIESSTTNPGDVETAEMSEKPASGDVGTKEPLKDTRIFELEVSPRTLTLLIAYELITEFWTVEIHQLPFSV